MRDRYLITSPPWKGICTFALPVYLGLLLQCLYMTADSLFLGNYEGEAALSAVGATNVLNFFFLAVANGLSAGACVKIARLFGEKQTAEMRHYASTSILLLLGLGVVAGILGYFGCVPFFKYVTDLPKILQSDAVLFFRILCLGMVFSFAYNIFAGVLRGIGDSRASLYFLLASSLLNVGLDWLFIAVFKYGVTGAAVATIISQLFSCVLAWLYMTKRYPEFKWRLKEFTFSKARARDVINIGVPMALQQMVVTTSFTCIQRAANSFGPAMTASFVVAQKIEMLFTMPALSLQISQASFVGQNIGARRPDRVLKGAWQTILIAIAVTTFFSLTVRAYCSEIIGIFGLSPQAVAYCTSQIETTSLGMIILTSYFPILGLLQGLGLAWKTTIIAVSVLSVRVGSIYLLKDESLMGAAIIWFNGPFGWILGFMLSWFFALKALKKLRALMGI